MRRANALNSAHPSFVLGGPIATLTWYDVKIEDFLNKGNRQFKNTMNFPS